MQHLQICADSAHGAGRFEVISEVNTLKKRGIRDYCSTCAHRDTHSGPILHIEIQNGCRVQSGFDAMMRGEIQGGGIAECELHK